MKKLMLLGVFMFGACFCMSSQGTQAIESRIYSGNPRSSNITTYIYLCRKGVDPLDPCRCAFCDHKRLSGLSIGVICADEEYKEFNGFNPDTTNNIIWSASLSFGTSGLGRCSSIGKGALKFKYHYNPERYNGDIDNFDQDGEIKDDPAFLHMDVKDASGMYSKILENGDCYVMSTKEWSIVRTLRTAIFRWRIAKQRITDFLRLIGEVGEVRHGTRIVPKYSYGGISVYNCATFLRNVMYQLEAGPELAFQVSPVKLGIFTTMGVGGWALVGASVGGPLGAVVGATGGLLASGLSFLVGRGIGKVATSTPEAVINQILSSFEEIYKKASTSEKREINRFFSVIIHSTEEINRFKTAQSSKMRPAPCIPGSKTVADAIAHFVKMGKGKATIFLDKDFQKK